MTMMKNDQQSITTLIAAATQLNRLPQNGAERACMVRMPDGSERLGMTQNVTLRNTGAIHNGATFHRVSFRFTDDDSPSGQYSNVQDCAWCIIDHRNCLIAMGPAEGMRVRSPGLGIGSYLVAQLIRLMTAEPLRGNYRIQDVPLPLPAQEFAECDDETNSNRIVSMFGRAGFYVAETNGGIVIGSRRVEDLRQRWNSEKVRFLSFPQFVEVAVGWNRQKQQSERAVEAAQEINESLNTKCEDLEQKLSERDKKELEDRRNLEGLVDQLKQSSRADQEVLESLRADLIQEKQEVARLQGIISSQADLERQRVAERKQEVVPVDNAGTMTIALSAPLIRVLWGVVAVAGLAVIVQALPLFGAR